MTRMSQVAREWSVFESLKAWHGAPQWWPADGCLEVVVGAVLTQNTAWTNVEKALSELKRRRLLSVEALLRTPPAELAEAIRSSGYYRLKAQRLKNVAAWIRRRGGLAALRRLDTGALRAQLLSVCGIGPETADDILLYAFDRPVFVVDAYTRRLFQRLGLINGREPYEVLRARFEAALPRRTQILNDYHALIVIHAKAHCRVRPLCAGCPLAAGCSKGLGNEQDRH
ncbi:MAG TPA: endonuclease III domain-containing protein [Acidiferrobacteraceae bacterium]|nr:endonuclease III domain-containing protein [Acidiferrobacteraceae bacterium]